MVRFRFNELVANTASILDMNDMEIGTVSNVSFVGENDELSVSQTVSVTPK